MSDGSWMVRKRKGRPRTGEYGEAMRLGYVERSGDWQITAVDEYQEEHSQHQAYCSNYLYKREGIV